MEGRKRYLEFEVGEKYVLDKEYNNSSIITLVWKGRLLCRVRSEDGKEWDTMLNRLSPIENKDEKDITKTTE